MRRTASRLVLALLLAAPAARAQTPERPARPVPIYGLELERGPERERLLIFAEGPLEPSIETPDAETLVVRLPVAVLDPSAPTDLVPEVAGTVVGIVARELRGQDAPEVRIEVRRRPGGPARTTRRGSILDMGTAHSITIRAAMPGSSFSFASFITFWIAMPKAIGRWAGSDVTCATTGSRSGQQART